MSVAYYRDFETGRLYALVSGQPGMFMLDVAGPAAGRWKFLEPGSDQFDYFHQKIFRNFKAEQVDPASLEPAPPPLPEPPKGPFLTSAQRKGQGQLLDAADYPQLAAWLALLPGKRSEVYVVLKEDCYETALGDGKAQDAEAVFPSLASAQQFIKAQELGQFIKYEIARFSLVLDGDAITSPDFAPHYYQHYSLHGVASGVNQALLIRQ